MLAQVVAAAGAGVRPGRGVEGSDVKWLALDSNTVVGENGTEGAEGVGLSAEDLADEDPAA